jgi:hypothetical protein
MPRRERRDHSNIKNQKAYHLFECYEDLNGFLRDRDYDTLNLDELLRHDTVWQAAKILHAEAMALEYPNQINKDGSRKPRKVA